MRLMERDNLQNLEAHPAHMKFQKFVRMVDDTEAHRIEGLIHPHIRLANQQSPPSDDAILILRFARFFSSEICPPNGSQEETGFYKRTAQRMVEASLWQEEVLDQFS